MTNSASDSFLLGEIKATVIGTAEDVKAIRNDMGELARRVGGLEVRIEAIEAEREVLVPLDTKFKHDTNFDLQKLLAWHHEVEGGKKGIIGAAGLVKWAWTIGAAIVAFCAGHFLSPETPSAVNSSTAVSIPR